MAEETAVVDQPIVEENKTPEVKSNPFGKSDWTETPPEIKKEEKQTEVKPTEALKPPVDEEEILDPNDWVKREFEGSDVTSLKAEREEYKKLKAQSPQEIKFENEQSKQIHELLRQGKRKEVREFLETQERLDMFTGGDVTKDTAPEIIKLGMQLSNKLLTPAEIEFQYKQDYGYPKEPVQKATEDEEEFKERHNEWKEQVSNIDMKKVVAAKMAIPQLEQLKTKIVLPELEKPKVTVQEPSQESLAALAKIRENFLSQLESNYSKVSGFDTKVKYETGKKGEYAEIPVSFKIPDEDRNAIKGRLSQDFDVENYIGDRWFDDRGNPKIEQIITDIFELENRDKIHQGIANEAATKRLDEYIKSTKNSSIGKTHQQTFDPEKQNGAKKVSPFAKDAWSESAPIIQN